MKRTLMIGVAAGALLAGINLAAAQGMMERQQPGASGGAGVEQKGKEQKGKAETKGQLKAQGSGELKAQGGGEPKAQGGSEQKGGKARAQAQGDMKAGGELKAQDQKPDEKKMKGEKGKSAQSKDQLKSGASGDTKQSGSATTGQAAGGGAKASLTAEQKIKVRETVFKSGPRVTKVNFSLSVGTVVPRTVRFAVLPPILVEVYPQWRGYEYFIVEDEIIIVEPRTLRIVAVIVV